MYYFTGAESSFSNKTKLNNALQLALSSFKLGSVYLAIHLVGLGSKKKDKKVWHAILLYERSLLLLDKLIVLEAEFSSYKSQAEKIFYALFT